jgi:beta-arrestin
VQYKVKVKIVVAMGGDLAVELPFTLTHPKPPPTPSSSRQFDQQNFDDQQAIDVPVDHNLIQLDANFDSIGHDDDFIFEEFARIRLKGHEVGPDDTEA